MDCGQIHPYIDNSIEKFQIEIDIRGHNAPA